jgi:hypothetical protein
MIMARMWQAGVVLAVLASSMIIVNLEKLQKNSPVMQNWGDIINEESTMLDENTSLTQEQWDQIVQLWEEYQINSNLEIQSTNIKSQAIDFLSKKNKKLTRSDIRRFNAKIKKLKNSKSRVAKFYEDKLLKDLQQVLSNDRI